MCAKSEILTYLESQEDLNSAPPVLSDVLSSVFRDASSGKKQITVSHDPGLTTRMLRVADLSSTASSEISGSRLLITSVAIYNELYGLGYVDDRISPEIWRHSLEAANIAEHLAGRIDPSLAERAYLCGLLHDIGMIAILKHFPEEAGIIRDLVLEGAEIVEAERKVIGIDHQAVGRLVAERWDMPEEMKSAISGHHPTDENIEAVTSQLSLITIVAHNLSSVHHESPVVRDETGPAAKITKECCRRLEIGEDSIGGIYSILPRHLFATADCYNQSSPEDFRNYVRMNNELFGLYTGLASMFRERQQISRQLLREKYVKASWESLNIALSTISHYMNNSMSIVSGEGEILRQVYDNGDTDEALARIPDVTRAISKTSKRISLLLDELSNIAGPDELRYFKDSRAIDIRKTIEERLNTEIPAVP